MKTLLTSIFLALICGCAASQTPLLACLQPSDRIVAMAGCATSAQPVEDADPVVNVAKQAQIPGNVILYVGNKDDAGIVQRYPLMLAEAKKYPGKFTHVYLIDEMFWCNTGVCIGRYEQEVIDAAKLAHDSGFKTVCTFLPDVILDPRFSLQNVNMCDGISIDVYPGIRPTTPNLNGCSSGLNYLGDLLLCSIRKLRSMGFVGDTGYIYQAFGFIDRPVQPQIDDMLQQRLVIDNAAAMGVKYMMPYGLYLGAPELSREPILYPLGGTPYEYLVRP